MNLKNYYYNQFRTDFTNFWKKVPNRQNYVTAEPLFKFTGLVKNNNFDTLSDIAQDDLCYFLSALGCTILIDQVMFTYFKKDYPEFQSLTLYPKMEIGWMNANPWMVFHQNVRLSRGLHKKETVEKFSKFVDFFIDDLKEFFGNQDFTEASWKNVKNVMSNDRDIAQGSLGAIFIKKLQKDI